MFSLGSLQLPLAFLLLLIPESGGALSAEEFTCSQELCQHGGHVCDFTDDNVNGSNETNCTKYQGCDFEDGFCDLIQISNSVLSGWIRTVNAPGLKHDHKDNPLGHFLTLVPSGGNRTTADLISPVFLPSQNCKLSFYYHAGAKHGYLQVFVRNNVLGEMTQVWKNSTLSPMETWLQTVIALTSNHSFQVHIRGEFSANSEASEVLALDDLSFGPGCVNTTDVPSVPACPPPWFACDSGECLEERKVCDFTPHCPHGEDEASCPSKCDFNNDSCGWHDITPGDGFEWVRGTPADVPTHYFGNSVPPDHSTNSSTGHFMFILKKSNILYPAVLRGPTFTQSASGCTITFWHYNTGISVGGVDMYLQVDGIPSNTIIWRTLFDQGTQWKQVTLQLGRITRPFSIALAKFNIGVFNGISAFDDVTFSNCSIPPAMAKCPSDLHFHCTHTRACVELLKLCDLVDDCGDGSDEEGCSPEMQCNFEDGLCNWRQDHSGADAFDWTHISGSTPTVNTGPWRDHTLGTLSGHYVYIESSAPQQFKDTALLLSRVFQATHQRGKKLSPLAKRCVFRFHYHMFGPHVFCLAVYLRTTATGKGYMLWVRYGNQGDVWHRKNIYLSSPKPFQILIEGTVGDDLTGDIAIDDLSFLNCEPYDGELPKQNNTSPSVTTQAPTVQPHTCPDGMFACQSHGECVAREKVCDFRPDCSDGLDELHCVKEQCDFEGGNMCGWECVHPSSGTAHAFLWSPNQGGSIHDGEEFHRPVTDHTLGSLQGWYLCADSSNGGYGHSTDLQTPIISSTGPLCTLVFWYYMNGFTVGSLQVLLKHGNASHEVWSQSGNQGNKWRRGEVFLGLLNNFQVVFRAKRGISYMGDLVIDDVSFLHCSPLRPSGQPCTSEQYACMNGHCIPEGNLCDFINHCGDNSDEDHYICKGFSGHCNFEFDMCSWRQSKEDHFDWLIKAGSTPTAGTGPSNDHTLRDPSGHYLYLEGSFPQAAGDTARISGPMLSHRSSQCKMRFYFHMSGDGIGTLSVLRSNHGGLHPLLNLTGDQGNYWQMREVPLSDVQDFQVVFEGKVGQSPKGDICLDDITFSPGCLLAPASSGTTHNTSLASAAFLPCDNGGYFTSRQVCDFVNDCGDSTSEKHCGTSCSFENGRCGWVHSLANNFDWTLGVGSVKGSRPPSDHTLMNGTGHFVYLEVTPVGLKGDRAHMGSSVWKESSATCKLSFWYYISHMSLGTIRVLIKTENNLTEVWNKSGHQENYWKRAEVPLRQLRNFKVIFEGIRLRDLSGGAALDDLEFIDCAPNLLDPGSCPSDTDFICHSGQCIESHLVCDSQADCADGSDELDCEHILGLPGSCSFNMGEEQWEETCQLVQSSDDDFDWRMSQRSALPPLGPYVDHSPGGDGKFLYIDSIPQRDGDIAKVTTKSPFPASIGLCHLRFWFYMHGSDRMGTLKIYTVGPNGNKLQMWATTGNHGPHWKYANVILSNPGPFTVTFQGEVGGDMWTNIALDDISFTPECVAGVPVTPQPLTCSADHYQCANTHQCIPRSWRCDGEPDCIDKSDEESCSSLVPGTVPPQDGCSVGQYRCSNALCLPSILRCDGVADCPDGEDENGCSLQQCDLGELVCEGSHGCIPLQRRCDRTTDCLPFHSDESSCHECPQLYCLNGGSCNVGRHGPVCTCHPGWTGNRCQVKEKPYLSTAAPEPRATYLGAVYMGITIGLLLLVAGVTVCLLASCKERCYSSKPSTMNYGVMDDPAFSTRTEPRTYERAAGGSYLNPSSGSVWGLPISVYPWRRETENTAQTENKLSFPNPLYSYPPNAGGAECTSSEA